MVRGGAGGAKDRGQGDANLAAEHLHRGLVRAQVVDAPAPLAFRAALISARPWHAVTLIRRSDRLSRSLAFFTSMHAAELADPASDNIGRDHTLAPIDLGQWWRDDFIVDTPMVQT
jgi:hypothetical protein